jgi:cytosine/adenosine deaminase-related metal-dependent hydrolase
VRLPLLAAWLALSACSTPESEGAPAAAAPLALTDVTVVDGTGAPPLPHRTVVIEGGRIRRIVASGSEPLPAGAQVMELSGHYLIPGLIDAHAHLATFERGDIYPALLRSMLLGGVTTMRDMGGNTGRVAALAHSVRDGALLSPRLYYSAVISGPEWFATYDTARIRYWSDGLAPGSAPGVRVMRDTTDLEALVAQARRMGATGVKIYSDVPPARLAALAAAAHRQGLRVWSHAVVPPTRPEEVVAAGVDVVSHADQLIWAAAGEGDTLPSRVARQRLIRRVTPRSPEIQALLGAMRARGTALEPTLLVMVLGGERVEGAQRAAIDSIVGWASAVTAEAYRMGVPIVAGTDAIGGYTPNIHSEMQLLVARAGLTPLDALRAATDRAARAIGAQDSLGTVAVGKLADLVVLRADPTADIRNTQTVAYVIQGGRVHRREGPWRTPQLAEPPVR